MQEVEKGSKVFRNKRDKMCDETDLYCPKGLAFIIKENLSFHLLNLAQNYNFA